MLLDPIAESREIGSNGLGQKRMFKLIPSSIKIDLQGPLTLSLSREGRGYAFTTAAACPLSPCGRGLG